MLKKKKKNKIYGSVYVLLIFTAIIAVISFITSIFEMEAYKTVISNNTLESVLVTTKNLISIEGFKYLVGNIVENFSVFKPLVLMIISVIGIGVCEESGLLYATFSKYKRVKFEIVIFITLLIGMISTVIGDYSYVFLIPLIGVIYKYLEKNPILGILTVFIGITIGYGTGIIFNYSSHELGIFTEAAATLRVDPNYKFSLFSNIYIMLFSTFFMSYIGTIVIDKFLVPKFNKKLIMEEEIVIDKKAKKTANMVFLVAMLFIIYMILPLDLPFAGILLDSAATRYIEKLFGFNSPFSNGFVFIVTMILMLCGYIYGRKTGNIKSSHDFSLSLSKNFENLGFLFVLMFFISQITAIMSWTNLDTFVVSKLMELMNSFEFSGLILIISFIIIVVIMCLFMPDTLGKWELISPTVIPLFMQSNITPGFTQFIFQVADGIGKCFTPLFTYYIISTAFLEKYKKDEKTKISILGIYSKMIPTIAILSLVWIAIISLWYLIGFKTGLGIYSTL